MSDALRKALGGLRGDALRSQRHGDNRELQIRIGLVPDEEEGGATFPNELVEPEATGGEKLPGTQDYPAEETRRRRSR